MSKRFNHVIKSSLTFKLNHEYFAINVGKVISILEMKKITEVPESPPFMKGVINLRGEVIPVIDSHIKFGLDPIKITLRTGILILEVDAPDGDLVKVGLLVDYVEEVIDIDDEKILAPPKIKAGYRSKYITGMYEKENGDLIMLLDIDQLLTLDEITPLKEQNEDEGVQDEQDKSKDEK